MTNLNNRFGRMVREHRESLSLSQESLAERADLNRSYLGEIERGQVVPSLATMNKLAHALETKLSTLILLCEDESQTQP